MHIADMTVSGVSFTADLSGALYWDDERLLVVSDLHLEKGSSFAMRGVLLPPHDTTETLARLDAVIARFQPRTVIALGDSFHDREAHDRLTVAHRATLATLQARTRLDLDRRQSRSRLAGRSRRQHRQRCRHRPRGFRHEPTGAVGEIAGHLHPKARVSRRGRSVERRCFASDGERAVMPAFGAYTGGLSIRDLAFATIFKSLQFTAHVLGDSRMHAIAAARCY